MKKTLICMSLALLGAQAMAADAGWYVGGDLTSTKFKADGESERKTGIGAFGGYALNKHIAFEAQARVLGSWDVDGVDVSANSLSLSMLAKAPVAEQFVLFGRIGFARNSIDARQGGFSASAHESKALIGIGAEYLINKNMSVRGEFVNLGNNKINDFSVKIQQFSVGFAYRF
jgi:OOP family OmpA-OmpF porin